MIDMANGEPALPQPKARELTEKEFALVAGGFGWKGFFHDVVRDASLGRKLGTVIAEPGFGFGVGIGVGIAQGVHDGLGR